VYGIIANDAHLLLKCKYDNVKLRLFQKKKTMHHLVANKGSRTT